jgi:hypothetical protein
MEALKFHLFPQRPDVELRVYGHYKNTCDLSFLVHLGNVRRFAADCLLNATGIENISHIQDLQSLSVGIHNLDNFNFLNHLQVDRLEQLSLGPTFSKKPSLLSLNRFTQLESLNIEGQQKSIEVIGQLPRLKDLTLRSITVPSLGFLSSLTNLRSLNIKLGGTKNLDAVAHLKSVNYLELWQIKGLHDLSPISEMTGLQFLFLQSLKNVTRLPDFSHLQSLRRLHLESMQGLDNLTQIESAPALEDFIHLSAHGTEPSCYEILLKKSTLKRIIVGTGSEKKNQEIRKMMNSAKIEQYTSSPFHFAETP